MTNNNFRSMVCRLATAALFFLLVGCAANKNNRFQNVEILRPAASQFTSLSIIFVTPETDRQDPLIVQGYSLSKVLDKSAMRSANERIVNVLKFNGIQAEYVDTFGLVTNLKTFMSTALAKSSHVLLLEPVGVSTTRNVNPIGGSATAVASSTRYKASLINKAGQQELQYYSYFSAGSPPADIHATYAATLINTLTDYGLFKRSAGDVKIPPR